jgi:hypothetical protein
MLQSLSGHWLSCVQMQYPVTGSHRPEAQGFPARQLSVTHNASNLLMHSPPGHSLSSMQADSNAPTSLIGQSLASTQSRVPKQMADDTQSPPKRQVCPEVRPSHIGSRPLPPASVASSLLFREPSLHVG